MVRLRRSAPQQQVHLLLREKATVDPTQCGPNHPIIGAVLSEAEAIRLEHQHPGIGFCWETFPLQGRVDEAEPDTVWVVSLPNPMDETIDDALDDPSPQAVFRTVDAARAWVRRGRDELVILAVPVGGADASAPRWKAEELGPVRSVPAKIAFWRRRSGSRPVRYRR